jgi:hypothetical protein
MFTEHTRKHRSAKRSPQLRLEPLGSPNGYQFGCPSAKAVTQPHSPPYGILLTCTGFKPHEELKLLADCCVASAQRAFSEDHNRPLTCGNVELRGFEPLTSCMPSVGSTSSRVHLCRSPSWSVSHSAPPSGPVAVLSCCTVPPPLRSLRLMTSTDEPQQSRQG